MMLLNGSGISEDLDCMKPDANLIRFKNIKRQRHLTSLLNHVFDIYLIDRFALKTFLCLNIVLLYELLS